jgi:hypothetical protein
MTLARGARRTPCSAASDGRATLDRPGHHAARGIGERLRRIPTPLSSSVRRGSPRLRPRQVRGWRSGAPALGRSIRHAGQGIGLRPPAPALWRGPAGEPTPHLRGRRTMPRSERAVTYCVHIVSIESYYPRGANLTVALARDASLCTGRHQQVPARRRMRAAEPLAAAGPLTTGLSGAPQAFNSRPPYPQER